jgi:hypothetical protein
MRQNARANGTLGEFAPQLGTPYAMYREPLLSPSGPCNPPPWGTLAAVDLARGAVRWEVPLGMVPQLAGIPGAAGWGSPNFPGGLNGRQLADEARRRRRDLLVLFTTGYTRNAIIIKGGSTPALN